MQRDQSTSSTHWPSLALITGGGLMIGLWLIFTNVHGPTSYDLNRPFLGQRTLFWGMLLGGPPNLLVAAALLGLAPRLTQGAPRRARVGLGLAVFGLAIAGTLDLIVRALTPPFFIPLIGVGVLLLALGRHAGPALPRVALTALVVIGALALMAMAWWFVPLEVFDALTGYRWYGLMAHVGPGLGWIVLGLALRPQPLVFSRPART